MLFASDGALCFNVHMKAICSYGHGSMALRYAHHNRPLASVA